MVLLTRYGKYTKYYGENHVYTSRKMVAQHHIYTIHHSRSSDYGHNGVLDQSATTMTTMSSQDEFLHTRNQWLL